MLLILLALSLFFLSVILLRTRMELRSVKNEVRAYALATTNDLLALHTRLLTIEDFLTRPRNQQVETTAPPSKQDLPN